MCVQAASGEKKPEGGESSPAAAAAETVASPKAPEEIPMTVHVKTPKDKKSIQTKTDENIKEVFNFNVSIWLD